MANSPLFTRTAIPLIPAQRQAKGKRAPTRKARPGRAARAGAPIQRAPAPAWSRLDFTMLTQEQGNWCWCATSLSVHRYYNATSQLAQCQAANLILGRTDACSNPTGPNVNTPWTLDDALSDLGNLREPIIGGTVSWDAVKAEIDAGRPLGCRTAWSGGGAHFVCIEGYFDGTTRMVAVDDPASGQSDVNFSTFTTMYRGSGSWTHSYKVKSSRIRILNAQVPAGAAVRAVSRHPSKLDAFVVDRQGRVLTAATDEGYDHGPWRGWWEIQGGRAKPGAPVACVHRGPDRLDVFVVGTDGGIYTAAWDQRQANGAWRGWWRIGNLVAPQGAPIGAVSRSPDHLDIFVVDVNGNVMSAAWQTGDTQWRGWWHIQAGRAKPGAYVSAVARESSKLDIFVVGTDGRVYTAAWDAQVANGAWRGWWGVASGAAAQGAAVTVVAREPTKLDVFVIGLDGRVYTAAWDQFVANGAWRGWWPVAGGMAKQGSPVACASREPTKLDVMTVGTDGKLYTAAWDQFRNNGQWRGWWRVGNGDFQQGIETTLLTRSPGSLDGFGAGTDGGVYLVCWNRDIARQQWRG
jgi:hypothetical protein